MRASEDAPSRQERDKVKTQIAIPLHLGMVLASLVCCGRANAQQGATDDVTALIRRCLVENRRNLNALRNYIYIQDETVSSFDKRDKIVKTSSRQREIFFLDGSQFERVISEDGKPLEEARRIEMERNLDHQIQEAAAAQHKEERERKAAKELANAIAIREDIADGFVFTKKGEAQCGSDACITVSAEPKAGFKGKSPLRALLPFLHGSILIDTQAGQWIDIDALPVRKVGDGIAYLNEDSAIHLHQSRISDDLWVITGEDIRIDARALWERKNMRVVRNCTNFRRFSSTVRIFSVDIPEQGSPKPVPVQK